MHLAIGLVLALHAAGQTADDKKSFDPFSDQETEQEEAAPQPEPKVTPIIEKDERPRVLVLVLPDIPSGTSLANRIGAEATRRVAKQTNLAPQSLDEALAPNAKKRRAEELRAALADAKKGMVAFEELDLEAAGAELETSINGLLAYTDDLDADARRTLEQAIFCMGATTLFERQTALAESTFVALLVLDPGYEPDSESYPSNVVSRFNDLKSKVEARPTGGLTVNTTPAGADVFVDGTFRGGSPLEINGLADGQHIVVVRRAGFKPFGTLAPVSADRQASIDVDLELEEEDSLARDLDVSLSRVSGPALALGKKLGVQKLAVLSFARRISGSKVAGLWLDVEKGSVLSTIPEHTVVEEPDVAGQTIAELIARLEAGPIVAEVKPVETIEKPSGPITDAWWFWAIAGTLAAAAAGAATVAIVSEARDNDTRPPPGGIVLGF